MKRIISIFKQLQETTSRTEKEAILKENANDEDFRRVLYFLYNPGKFKGTLGALIVDYKGNSVNVGSGFTDVDRNLIWNNMRDEIVGKIVEVQYFEESSNQDGGISLRFPVFIQIRDDKTEPSYD